VDGERRPHGSAAVSGQRTGRAERDHPPAVDDRDPVAERLGLLHEVGHQHDGGAAISDPANQVPRGAARGRVETGGQLVEEDDLGPAEQRERDEEALLLAAGEGGVGAAPQVAKPPLGQHGVHIGRSLVQPREQPDGFAHPQALGQGGGLQLRAGPPAQFLGVAAGIQPEHSEPAAVAAAQALQDLHGGGLARSVRSQDAEDLPAPDVEGDLGDGNGPAVPLLEVFRGDDGVHGWTLGNRSRPRRRRKVCRRIPPWRYAEGGYSPGRTSPVS